MPTAANNPNDRMTEIATKLGRINARIEHAAQLAGRNPADISLIAVSKTKPLSDVLAAHAAGQIAFGENYAQELHDKANELTADWHFIGPLQSNKTKLVANAANWVHSIDRLKIAQRLNEQRSADLPPLNICLQINISNAPQKAGINAEDAGAMAVELQKLPQLSLRGLMCIPEPSDHDAFARMQQLAEQLTEQGHPMDALSMGMSSDFEQAIAHGATHLRVGTAIFGSREA